MAVRGGGWRASISQEGQIGRCFASGATTEIPNQPANPSSRGGRCAGVPYPSSTALLWEVCLFFIGVALMVLASLAHVALMRQPRNGTNVLGIVLLYIFVFIVALSGFFAFLGHTFRADEVAQQIGWPPGSPFQFEVAVTNLAFGVLGLLAIWFRGNFWLATAIGYAVFMMGAGIGHVRQLIVADNQAPLNAGAMILTADLAVPLILLVLVVIHRRLTGEGQQRRSPSPRA